jgi:hypothetical protein
MLAKIEAWLKATADNLNKILNHIDSVLIRLAAFAILLHELWVVLSAVFTRLP